MNENAQNNDKNDYNDKQSKKQGFRQRYVENYKKYSFIGLAICIAILPFIFIPAFSENLKYYDAYHFPKFIFLFPLTMYISLMYFAGRLLEGNFKLSSITKIEYPFYIMLLWLIFSTILSPHKDLVFTGFLVRHQGFATIISYLLLFYIGFKTCKREYVEKYMRMILILSIPLSIYGILQYFNIEFLPRDNYHIGRVAALSTFGNRNFTASYASLMLGFATIQYIRTKKNIDLMISAILFALLIATQTRGAWLGSGFAFIVTAIVFRHFLKENLKQVVTLSIAFIIILGLFNLDSRTNSRFASFSNEVKKITSADASQTESLGSGRGIIYLETLKILPQFMIIGSGPDTFSKSFNQEAWREYRNNEGALVNDAHSEYLHIWVTKGFPFLLAYLILLLFILKAHYRNRKKSMNIVLFCGLLAYISQASFNIAIIGIAPIFWATLGMNDWEG